MDNLLPLLNLYKASLLNAIYPITRHILIAADGSHMQQYNGYNNIIQYNSYSDQVKPASQCLQIGDQKHKNSLVLFQFDGNSTLDENAADLGAVRIAWETWWRVEGKAGGESLSRLPLPPSRLFFLFSAQLYCSKLSAQQYIVNVEDDSHMTAPERLKIIMHNN